MIHILFRLFRNTQTGFTKKKLGMLIVLFSIWLYATTGFMFFELPNNPDLNWSDASWWSIVTMTTVGYGDLFPTTKWGRILVGYPTMLLGVSILGYLLSLVASGILESKMREMKGMKQILFTEHILICGFSSIDNILKIVTEIRNDKKTENTEIVLIDEYLDEIPVVLKENNVFFVKGNAARESTLNMANFREAGYMFIMADLDDLENTDQKNLAVALTAERLHPDIITIVECANPENAIFFERAKCDGIVCVQALSSQIMVQEMQDPGVNKIVEELTSNKYGMQFYMMDIPPEISDYGKMCEYFKNERAITLGIYRNSKSMFIPPKEEKLISGDKAIIIADERLH